MPWPSRASGAVLPGVFALWASAFLWPYLDSAVAVVPVGFAAGGLLVARRPAAGSLLVAATQAAGLLLGAPAETVAGLLPAIYCLFLAGRRLPPIRGSGVLAAYVAVVIASGFGVSRTLVGVLLFAGTWLTGQLVREGATVVRARRAMAEVLERRDHEAAAAQVVDRERGRILAGSLDVVGQAVASMRADALGAAQSLDPALLERVGNRGEAAIADLRRILGLLRASAPGAAVDRGAEAAGQRSASSSAEPAEVGRRAPWPTDGLLAVALSIVGLVEAVGHSLEPASRGLSAAVPLGLMLWRTAPGAAALVCALPMALALALDVPLAHGVAEMVTIAMLAWVAATTVTIHRGRGAQVRAMVPPAVVVVLSGLGTLDSPAVSLVPLVIAVVASAAAWIGGRVQRARHEVDGRITRAQSLLWSSVDDALVAERLRIARELHDITSHAVGAMVLQARAALALATRDRDAARRAVDNALVAGDRAMRELGQLATMLHDETQRWEPESLQSLVARLSATGLDIDLGGDLPADPHLAFTVHRIVQESLANSARYAPGGQVRVRVDDAPDRIRVLVQDGGGRYQSDAPSGTGFGLDGLAERVRLQGGQLQAGPDGRGFRVSAILPKPADQSEEG